MSEIFDAARDLAALRRLFIKYYEELECEDDPQYLFDEFIARDVEAGVLGAALIACGESEPVGFVIFQIDDMINDWCFKEGWGDVREIFVDKPFRGRGLGRELLAFAAAELQKEGAEDIYLLPTDESEGFFRSCGYGDIGEYCADVDSKVFGIGCRPATEKRI